MTIVAVSSIERRDFFNRRCCLLEVGQLQPSNSIASICCGFVVYNLFLQLTMLSNISRRAVRLR